MSEVIKETTQSTPPKTKPFRFNTQLYLLLCKAVSEKRAHVPPVNKKTEMMNETCALFISVLPQAIREKYMDPKGKTCSDHFELLVSQRRDENKRNANASGISEEQTEMNELLDDLILQRDEVEEDCRKVREEKTAQDKKLCEAAKEIRSQATSRMSRKTSEESTAEESDKKRRKVVTINSYEEELELLKDSLAERRENERKRMALDRERLELEKEQTSLQELKAKKQMELEEKRLEIEAGRLEIDRQKAFAELAERRAGVEERKAMVGAFNGLAKKLG